MGSLPQYKLNEILIVGAENYFRHAKNRVSQTFFEIQLQAGYTSNNRCSSGTTNSLCYVD